MYTDSTHTHTFIHSRKNIFPWRKRQTTHVLVRCVVYYVEKLGSGQSWYWLKPIIIFKSDELPPLFTAFIVLYLGTRYEDWHGSVLIDFKWQHTERFTLGSVWIVVADAVVAALVVAFVAAFVAAVVVVPHNQAAASADIEHKWNILSCSIVGDNRTSVMATLVVIGRLNANNKGEQLFWAEFIVTMGWGELIIKMQHFYFWLNVRTVIWPPAFSMHTMH